jgi:hypothetical protein
MGLLSSSRRRTWMDWARDPRLDQANAFAPFGSPQAYAPDPNWQGAESSIMPLATQVTDGVLAAMQGGPGYYGEPAPRSGSDAGRRSLAASSHFGFQYGPSGFPLIAHPSLAAGNQPFGPAPASPGEAAGVRGEPGPIAAPALPPAHAMLGGGMGAFPLHSAALAYGGEAQPGRTLPQSRQAALEPPARAGGGRASAEPTHLRDWKVEQERAWERHRQMTRMATGRDIGPVPPEYLDPKSRVGRLPATPGHASLTPTGTTSAGSKRPSSYLPQGPERAGAFPPSTPRHDNVRVGRPAEVPQMQAPLQIVRNRFVSRKQWGARPPDFSKGLKRSTVPFNTITLHHSGREDSPQAVQNLHLGQGSWWRVPAHKSKLLPIQDYSNYADVGYNFMIGEHGEIYEGRPLSYEGAHVFGHNEGNIGIVMLGDYSTRRLSRAQHQSLKALMAVLKHRYPTIRNVLTHGQFDSGKGDELIGAFDQIEPLLTKPDGFVNWRAWGATKLPRSP